MFGHPNKKKFVYVKILKRKFMALSQKVKDSLEEAQSNIRIALSYSAKNEKPIVNKQISEIMCAIQNVMKFEEMSDQLDEMVSKLKKNGRNGFFDFE